MNLHFLQRHMKHENTKYEYDFLWPAVDGNGASLEV